MIKDVANLSLSKSKIYLHREMKRYAGEGGRRGEKRDYNKLNLYFYTHARERAYSHSEESRRGEISRG